MTYENEIIHGTHCLLRPAREEDAEFIVALRNDPRLSRHISKGMQSAEEQLKWLQAYQERNKAGLEYYFIVCDLLGNSCGTVRVYAVTKREATVGSWVMTPGSPLAVSLESFLLPMTFIFETLAKQVLHIDVRKDNVRVWKWHELCGAVFLREDNLLRYYDYTPASYSVAEARVRNTI